MSSTGKSLAEHTFEVKEALKQIVSRAEVYHKSLLELEGKLRVAEASQLTSSLVTQPQFHFEASKLRAELRSLDESVGILIDSYQASLDLEIRALVVSGKPVEGTPFERLSELPAKTTEGFFTSVLGSDPTLVELKASRIRIRMLLGSSEGLEQAFRDRSMVLHDMVTMETKMFQGQST